MHIFIYMLLWLLSVYGFCATQWFDVYTKTSEGKA